MNAALSWSVTLEGATIPASLMKTQYYVETLQQREELVMANLTY